MFITTSATFLISTGELISRKGYDYNGPIDLACGGGPSASQQQLASAQAAFYSTMTTSYKQTFAGQQAILANLQSAWKPILDAGPGQYGFTPAEDAAMRSQATQGTAANYATAARAVNAGMAAKGGDAFIPSGAAAQMNSEVAQAAANAQSSANLGITEAGYAQGRANFGSASAALLGASQELNPTGYISGTNQAGNDAFSSATTNFDEAQAASPWNAVSGILGGALTAGVDAFTGGVGGSLAKSVMGGINKGQTPPFVPGASGGGDGTS
jgi:hypothetical protein